MAVSDAHSARHNNEESGVNTQSEALRLADALEDDLADYAGQSLPRISQDIADSAAAELRRLHAENASLAAALASSCDEQRHELWESGGIAGCERARVAERQRDALLEALLMVKEAATRMRGDDFNLTPEQWAKVHAAIAAVESGQMPAPIKAAHGITESAYA